MYKRQVRKGFAHIEPELGPDDVMAWFNSDDLVAPRALRFVASYFAAHRDVDVVYGHRIIIDDADREIGRWIMPRHEKDSIEWIDYVPQETLDVYKRQMSLSFVKVMRAWHPSFPRRSNGRLPGSIPSSKGPRSAAGSSRRCWNSWLPRPPS